MLLLLEEVVENGVLWVKRPQRPAFEAPGQSEALFVVEVLFDDKFGQLVFDQGAFGKPVFENIVAEHSETLQLNELGELKILDALDGCVRRRSG